MGKDLSIFSKHNLDTSSVKNLAIDLANRFNVNINYGFTEEYEFWKYDPSKYKFGFNSEGIIKVNTSDDFVCLTRENYLQRKIYEEIGDKIFEIKDVWTFYDQEKISNKEYQQKLLDEEIFPVQSPYQFNLFNETNNIEFTNYTFKDNDFPSIEIQKDYLETTLEFLCTWNGVTYMAKNEYTDGILHLNNYRLRHKEFVQGLGDADKCYYTSYGFLILEHENWKEFENEILKTEKALIESFSTIFSNEKAYENFKEKSENIIPDVYIDDFMDLEK